MLSMFPQKPHVSSSPTFLTKRTLQKPIRRTSSVLWSQKPTRSWHGPLWVLVIYSLRLPLSRLHNFLVVDETILHFEFVFLHFSDGHYSVPGAGFPLSYWNGGGVASQLGNHSPHSQLSASSFPEPHIQWVSQVKTFWSGQVIQSNNYSLAATLISTQCWTQSIIFSVCF